MHAVNPIFQPRPHIFLQLTPLSFSPAHRSLESSTSLDLIMPGSRVRNMYVTSEGSLKIEAPEVDNSGR